MMPRRKRRLASRVRDCVRRLLAFLFSNVGVIVLVVAYTIAGAFMFQAIEGANELEIVGNMTRERDNTAQYMWQDLTLHLNPLNETELKDSISTELYNYQRKIVRAVKKGWDGGHSNRQWSFSSAFLYSLTVITTIGYGHLSPRTSWGKITTIFYALLGMPLFLLYLANVGELLAGWFKCIYALVCLCRGCPGFTRRRVARLRTQLEISDAESIERPDGWIPPEVQQHYRHQPNRFPPDYRIPLDHGNPADYRIPSHNRHQLDHRISAHNRISHYNRVPPDHRIPTDYRIPPYYRIPPDHRISPYNRILADHRIPSDYRVPFDRRNPLDYRVPPHYRIPPDNRIPPDRRILPDIRIPPNRGIPPVRRIPSDNRIPVDNRILQEYRIPPYSRHVDRHPYDNQFPRYRHQTNDDNPPYHRYPTYPPDYRFPTERYPPDFRYPPHPQRHFQRRPDYFRSASMPQPWESSRYRPDPRIRGWSEPLGYRSETQESSEFSYVTFDAQTITVPISVCVCILIGYILFGSMLFGMWERWDQLDGAYFCFISLSSIGFGDFVPGERIYTPRIETSFIVCSMYLMLGMALVAMCFNLMQEQVIHYVAGLKRAVKRVCRCKR